MLRTWILLSLALLSTTACSKLTPSTSHGDLIQAPVSAKGLDGSWGESECRSDANWGQEVTSTATFAAGIAIETIKVWVPGSGCTQLEYTADLTLAYSLQQSATVAAAFDIDLTLLSAQITPQTADAASTLNSLQLKGVSDWVSGQTQSFSDFSSSDWQVSLYDVIVIQPSYLFWGDLSTGDGKTPTTRPTSIDSTNFQMRQ